MRLERASVVANLIRRYGDSKRGPITLRYLVGARGLRIEAIDRELIEGSEIAPDQLEGDEGVAKATARIDTLLARIRDKRSRERVQWQR